MMWCEGVSLVGATFAGFLISWKASLKARIISTDLLFEIYLSASEIGRSI